MNLFHVGIVKTSQKCDEAKVEQWIKKILKDAPNKKKVHVKKLGAHYYCGNIEGF